MIRIEELIAMDMPFMWKPHLVDLENNSEFCRVWIWLVISTVKDYIIKTQQGDKGSRIHLAAQWNVRSLTTDYLLAYSSDTEY